MMNMLNGNHIRVVLSSRSPRRESLIQGLDVPVKIHHPPEVDETYPPDMDPKDVPVFLAVKKSHQFHGALEPEDILVTADTIVLLNGAIVNKPENINEARAMLQSLSGQKHVVITGVCLRSHLKEVSFASFTDVFFSELSDAEISYYLERYEPLDKAGAYGIQEWIGYIGIKRINGSFYNVMGLPLHQLYLELSNFQLHNRNKINT